MQTFTLKAVSATVGADIDVNNKRAEPRWQIDAALGRSAEARITSAGFTLAKNWDAEMGPLSANVELRGHMSWRGVVRAKTRGNACARVRRAARAPATPRRVPPALPAHAADGDGGHGAASRRVEGGHGRRVPANTPPGPDRRMRSLPTAAPTRHAAPWGPQALRLRSARRSTSTRA